MVRFSFNNSLKNNEKKKDNSHIWWIDLCRCFAICCVILVHAMDDIYYDADAGYMMQVPVHTELFILICRTIGRMGVPLFIFISGYLLLDREYDTKKCLKFWKTNLLGLFITAEIWIVIHNVFINVLDGTKIDWALVVKNLLFIANTESRINHFWYLFMIVGMYVFIPFVAAALKKFDRMVFWFPLILLFCFRFVIPVFNVILSSIGLEDYLLVVKPDLSFGGGVYGCLLLLGYMCKVGGFRKIRGRYLLLVGGISFACTIWLQMFAFGHGYKYHVWYDCAFLIITCVCFFELMSRKSGMRVPGWMANLAKCSFGIYLVDYVVRKTALQFIVIEDRSLKVAVICVLTLLISWGIVSVVSHFPRIRKLLFYMK